MRTWYLLHSWAGIMLALLLFVVSATGCVMLFFDELQPWQHPELRPLAAAGDPIRFDRMLETAQQREWVGDSVVFQLPAHGHGVILRLPDESQRIAIFDPGSGELIAVKPEGFTRFLRRLHADLLLPMPVGPYLVGTLGIVLLLLVSTGVILHRRLLRQLLTWRTGRGWRLGWSDTHKLLGGWGLLFQALMAYTGALLGLAGLVFVLTATVAYRGDRPRAYATLVGSSPAPAGVPAPLADINGMLTGELNGDVFIPRYVTVDHPGDANARVVIDGDRPGSLSDLNRKVYDRNGRLLAIRDGVRSGAGWRAYSALVPLHFGSYGGLVVKLAYLLFGLAAVAMPVSGSVLWLDRQRRHPVLGRHVDRLHRLMVGVAAGFLPALASLFVIDKLGPGAWSAQPALTKLFFLGWGSALTWALCRPRPAQALRELLLTAGLLFMAAALANALVPGDHLGEIFLGRLTVVQVTDAVLLILGAGLAVAGLRRVQSRQPAPDPL